MPLYYLLYLWLLLSAKVPVTKIARANQLITEAENSYNKGQYVMALVKYRYLINSIQFRDSHIQLNLAHCYFLTNDKVQAQKHYEHFVHSPHAAIRSTACQQLGVIAFENKQYKKALEYFRTSLAADPNNEASRFNYELVARLIPSTPAEENHTAEKKDKTEEKAQDSPPPDPENTIRQAETENQDGQEQKNIEAEQQQEIQRKLRQINLSEEKAKMILEAMKNSEIQYIQQTKKESSSKEEKNLPDW